MKRMTSRYFAGQTWILCLLLSVLSIPWCGQALADPSSEYYRACPHAAFNYAILIPHFITRAEFNKRLSEGRHRADDSCAALVARLSRLPTPTPEESLALFQAHWWIGEDGDYCGAVMSAVMALPESDPGALQLRSVCSEDPEESLALLLRSLEADPYHPRHRAGLKQLYWKVWLGGAEVDSETLLRHLTTRYEIARFPGSKITRAALIYTTAIEAGYEERAEKFRARVRGDVGLDNLEFDRREATLELACDRAIMELDLEELCTEGMEQVAAESAALGEPLPPDILRPFEGAIRLIADTRLHLGGGGGPEERDALARLRTVLDDYPEHLKTSEHLRVYARALPEGPERIDALRRATNLDPGNLAARCGLAASLQWTAPDEAWSIFTELAARPDDLPWHCDPEASLQHMEHRAATGGPESEMPTKMMILD